MTAPGPHSLVDLDIRKWGDRPHYRMAGELLGHDDHGTWIGLPAGAPFTGPNGADRLVSGFVSLVPEREAWWIASVWEDSNQAFELYIDITTPARWPSENHLITVDLDLDVVRRRDGTAYVDDEDEFAENQVTCAYPPDVIEQARASARWLMKAVDARREPFDVAGQRWLEMLQSRASP